MEPIRGDKSLVDEVMTLRCHLEANHVVCNSDTFYFISDSDIPSSPLGQVSQLGKECRLLVKASWRH
jgi:hypothetical protein